VPAADAGVASATASTQQQLGTSIGTALLNTLAVSATTHYLITHLTPAILVHGHPSSGLTSHALLHGYTTAFWWAAAVLTAGAILSGALLRRGVLAGQEDSGQQSTPPGSPEQRQPSTRDSCAAKRPP